MVCYAVFIMHGYLTARLKVQRLTAADTDLDFEREIFLHVLDNEDEKRQLDGKGFLWIGRTCNVRHAAKQRYVTRRQTNKRDKHKSTKANHPYRLLIIDIICRTRYSFIFIKVGS